MSQLFQPWKCSLYIDVDPKLALFEALHQAEMCDSTMGYLAQVSREHGSGTHSCLFTGIVNDKRKRRDMERRERTAACIEFGSKPRQFTSIDNFVRTKRESQNQEGSWLPRKGQMVRDMKIFAKTGFRNENQIPFGAHTEQIGLTVPNNVYSILEPSGGATVLTKIMERTIIESLNMYETKYGVSMITPTFITSVATIEVLKNLPGIHEYEDITSAWNSRVGQQKVEIALRQLKSINGPYWMRHFLRRNVSEIRRTTRRRALESYKAEKHQVELVLAHFRNVYRTEALVQIQKECHRSNTLVDGFVRFGDIIQQQQSMVESNSISLLENRDGVIYVKVLNAPLEHLPAFRRYALDETPISPDSLLLKSYSTSRGVPLSHGRASIWTLLPVLCGNGTVLASLLLQRNQPVPVDTAKFTASHNFCIGATENAQQSDETWLKFAQT